MKLDAVKTLAFFFFLSGLAACSASYRLARKLPQRLEKPSTFGQSHTGLVVFDPSTQRYLIEHKADHLFTPASNTKLWTVFAAMQILKDSIPSVAYCSSNGHVFIKGMGDPTFLHPAYVDQHVYRRLRSLSDTLHYVQPSMTLPRYAPGWAWDDYPYYFQPERSLMPLYGNAIHVRAEANGEVRITPEVFTRTVSLECDTALGSPAVTRGEFKNQFLIRYDCHQGPLDLDIPFVTSDSLVATMLADTLKRTVVVADRQPGCVEWNHVYSAPLDSIYRDILVHSDNFLAEQLLINCALYLADTADQDMVIERIMRSYFPRYHNAVHWIDGSGLSRYNQFSPRSMVDLLLALYQSTPKERLFHIFPAGGVHGTLRNAFKSEEPYVFAKTGSMRYVYNLSGFLQTNSGKTLIFSFMNNHDDRPFGELKNEMAKILTTIKEDYR